MWLVVFANNVLERIRAMTRLYAALFGLALGLLALGFGGFLNHAPRHGPVDVIVHDEPYCGVVTRHSSTMTVEVLHHGVCVTANSK
jgi:hypothetical protein